MSSVALGAFQVTLVRAGIHYWDGGVLFGVVPKTLWGRKAHADELNRIPLGFNCYVIQTDEHTILIETGCGDKPDRRMRERMRVPAVTPPLAEIVAEHGIDPEKIDLVLNTHLHWDHCGGNTLLTDGGVRPAFPRATYYTRRGEWEHAHERHPRDSVSYVDANYDPLVESGRMRLVEADFGPAPGIRMCLAAGHNRDMMVVTATSQGQTFCFLSDLVPTAAHLAPTWVAAFDLFPLESIANKQRWLEAAAEGNWVCGFGHDPEMAFARVTKRDGKFELA
ncbi:MAG TPA: MBL fold metallo-hydrolase [Bryobacteraceae bacterium]|nr:MBL fold metallo-hydrolase [Bryobacteraceae bacterium]